MVRLKAWCNNIISYACCGIIVTALLPFVVICTIVPKRVPYRDAILYRLMAWFYHGVVWSLRVPVTFYGSSIPQEPCIIVANHESSLDVPVLGACVGAHPHVWYAMSYYLSYPVLGFFIRRLGIPLDTSQPMRAARTLLQSVDRFIDNTAHILIFPEGGRFTDGLHDFHSGFALLACRTGRPVVPVRMYGNGDMLPPEGTFLHHRPLYVVVGEPLRCGTDEDTRDFVDRVVSWYRSCGDTRVSG